MAFCSTFYQFCEGKVMTGLIFCGLLLINLLLRPAPSGLLCEAWNVYTRTPRFCHYFGRLRRRRRGSSMVGVCVGG